MKIKKYLIFSIVFVVNAYGHGLKIPEGRFSCAIEFEEIGEYLMEEGEDFPYFLHHLETPRLRKESLDLFFSKKLNEQGDSDLDVRVVNPEALPNWLLITPREYKNQRGWGEISVENREIYYQVSWPNTWYFGSGVDIVIRSFKNDLLKIDLRFNDNDSVGELHRWVKCRKY